MRFRRRWTGWSGNRSCGVASGPARSRAVLIGTGRFDSPDLPDHTVIRNNIIDLAGVLTETPDGVLDPANCAVVIDETDVGRLGGVLKSAVDDAEDLLLVYYAGHGRLEPRRHDLYLAPPGTDQENLGFTGVHVKNSGA